MVEGRRNLRLISVYVIVVIQTVRMITKVGK